MSNIITKGKAASLLYIAAGLLYIAVPHVLLPVCGYAGGSVAHQHAASAHGERAHGGHTPPAAEQHGGESSVSGHQEYATGDSEAEHAVCFWTAKAEAGLGGLVIFASLLLFFAGSPEQRSGITLMLAGVAVLGALIPSELIGVCRQESMPCRAGTLPALLLLSGFFFLFALSHSVYLIRRRKG
ncbi:MAG: DUF4418 family protein [Desulfovibrio sp.]|jgi:hypothetical protein|nr:DUF4418 family protein [Desulfovibrio sp.]